MGLFKSIGSMFVEEMPVENPEYTMETYDSEEEAVDAELEDVNPNTLIDDIYTQNNLYDKSQSIFKVEELIASLPKEMATDTKRTSVLAILGSFSMTATDVIEDGEQRMKILNSIKEKINADAKNLITEKEAQIEEYKKSIEALNIDISNEQETTRVSNETITAELDKIQSLVIFIGGTN